MGTIVPWQVRGDVPQVFEIGAVHVTIFPAGESRLARFLLHRTQPESPARVLIGSGSTQDTASCIEQATIAARRAGSPR